MSRLRFGWIVAVGFLMGLGLSSASRAEDSSPFAINCGAGCGVGLQAASDTLVSVVSGGIYVITVAHLAPSPEEAFVRGRPVNCRPVAFRVDTLRIGAQDGSIEVEIGEKQKLEAGKSMRIVQKIDTRTGAAGSNVEQLTFRLRAERVSPRCDLVAGGMFFDDGSSTKPVPFSLLVSDGGKWLGRFGDR